MTSVNINFLSRVSGLPQLSYRQKEEEKRKKGWGRGEEEEADEKTKKKEKSSLDLQYVVLINSLIQNTYLSLNISCHAPGTY